LLSLFSREIKIGFLNLNRKVSSRSKKEKSDQLHTTSFSATKGKIVTAVSKDKESSSSEESSDGDHDKSKDSSSSEESSDDDHDKSKDSSGSIDDQEQMLCNIIVRATHDLHVYQSKSADEITTYLNTDCENLGNEELVEQVSCFLVDKRNRLAICEGPTHRMSFLLSSVVKW
jgi:hypothetical protein